MDEVVAQPVAQPVFTGPAGTQDGQEIKPVVAETPAPETPPQEEETPEKRESRNKRRFNRERDARIAAETELRLLKEQRENERKVQLPVADDGAPKREQFETYEEYLKADARHVAKQEAAAIARKELEEARNKESRSKQQETQQKAVQAFKERIDAARDQIEDYDEVCGSADVELSRTMSEAILESDQGALIAYHLAKNPDEAKRISELKPYQQAAAIADLEKKVAKPKGQSKASPPIDPVGKRGGPESDTPTDKDDIETWMRKERARMEKAGVRL